VKITSIETIPICVPLKPGLAIKSGRGGTHSVSPFLIVKIHTDEGIIGLGEVSCTPRWSGEDQVTAKHFIDNYFAPMLIGEDPLERDTRHKFAKVVAGNPFTKAALEMALWDIRGKDWNRPVYAFLGNGEKCREYVPTKFSVSGVAHDRAAEIATWAIGQGFKKLKVKVGTIPDEDRRRVQAVRQAVGPDVSIGVDANGGWGGAHTARVAIDLLRPFNIAFIEQPLPAGDLQGMVEIRTKVAAGIPIIADESLYSMDDARNLEWLGAADVFSVYIGKAGGIHPAYHIAGFAGSRNIATTIGSNLELGIGSAAMTHLALARPEITAETYACDIIGPLFYEDDILKNPLPLIGGEARVHELPGLGVELDDEKVERYRVR
jgi:L-alanine-DL-glutamate epimerase-like enolase superfamily enzyme